MALLPKLFGKKSETPILPTEPKPFADGKDATI